MRGINLVLIAFVLFTSCRNSTGSQAAIHTDDPNDTIAIQGVKAKTIVDEQPPRQYTVSIVKVDALEYEKVRRNTPIISREHRKIADFKTAAKLLKGIVSFDANQMVTKIRCRNGKTYLPGESDGEGYFIAYFPDEDILLCEGGHTIDVSYDLVNGKTTEETGNPDITIASPGNTFRLNGWYGGQECYDYFIQQKIGGRFEKIIGLYESFDKATGKWLCVVRSGFWKDDRALWIAIDDPDENGEPGTSYYQLILKEK